MSTNTFIQKLQNSLKVQQMKLESAFNRISKILRIHFHTSVSKRILPVAFGHNLCHIHLATAPAIEEKKMRII